MKDEMRPLGGRVLVQRDETGEHYKGLIVIPERYRNKPQFGTVRAVGPDVTTVHKGDRVLFGRYAGIEVVGQGLIVWERDLMAVIE